MATAAPRPSTPALAALALFLMFAGVWTCDGAVLSLAALPGGYLSIRVFSLITYGLALAFAWRVGRGPQAALLGTARRRRLLNRFVAVGAALFVAGAAGLLLGKGAGPVAVGCVFLTKGIGPLLSVALLLLFARLDRPAATKAAALGMAGAFAFEAVTGVGAQAAAVGPEALFLLGALCLAGASAAVLELVRRRPAFPEGDEAEAAGRDGAGWAAGRDGASVGKEGLSGAATLGLPLTATALLLGFLRSDTTPSDSVGIAAALAVLLAVGAAAAWSPRLSPAALFRVAVACAAAGFLLEPLLAVLSPHLAPTLSGIGCALFEILIWIMSASAVRSHRYPLRVAAVMRLLAVVGHLLGTGLAVTAASLASAFPRAPETAGLVLVFVYLLMVLAFSKRTAAVQEEGTGERPGVSPGEGSAAPTAGERSDAGGGDRGSSRDATPDDGGASPAAAATTLGTQDFWQAPCAALSRQWKLTPREGEVLEQLAQGRDLAFMQEKFMLSRNTVKMHVRNVYAKLGVHGKQEVIDLVEATRWRL